MAAKTCRSAPSEAFQERPGGWPAYKRVVSRVPDELACDTLTGAPPIDRLRGGRELRSSRGVPWRRMPDASG